MEPDGVPGYRRGAARYYGDDGAPAHPAHHQVPGEDQGQRHPLRADENRVAGEQSGRQARRPRGTRPPEQERHADHDQERQQCLGHHHVLKLDLVAVKQYRGGGQRGPVPRHPAPPQQCVHKDAYGQAHQVLHDGVQDQAVERLKRAQEEGVAHGFAEIRPRPQGSAEVKVGVAEEPENPRVPDHGQYPENGSRSEGQREELVVPGESGQPGRRGQPDEGTYPASGRVQRLGGYGRAIRHQGRRAGDGAGTWTAGADAGTGGVCVAGDAWALRDGPAAHSSSCATKERAFAGQPRDSAAPRCPRSPCVARRPGSAASRSTASAAARGSPNGTTVPHSYRSTSPAATGSGLVITGTPCAMYSATFVGRECRKFGSSCNSESPASAPSDISTALSLGRNPCQRIRPAACARVSSARACASAGPIKSTAMPCGRSSRPTSIISEVPRSGDRWPM